MIFLHHPDGTRFALNPDLIETVEETPDTVVRLTSARRLLVSESADEIADLVRDWRLACIAGAPA